MAASSFLAPQLLFARGHVTLSDAPAERLPLKPGSESIMGVDLRKVSIPVAAGRNLAVLTEAAVRNYVLQLRGMDSMREFIERQSHQMQAVHDEDDRP